MKKILCHKDNYEEKLNEVSSWKVPESNKKKIKQFFKAYEIGSITGRICNKNSLLRYVYFLKVGVENLKGETEKDIKDFVDRLLKDKISYETQGVKKTYPLRSKSEILLLLNRFIKWKYPNKIKLAKILEIKINVKRPDIEILSEAEIKTLFKEAKNNARRYLIAVLNSSGLRAEEFHNIRYSDIQMPSGNENFVKITVRNMFSKTEGRTISLYEKNVLKAVKDYLNERINEGIKPEDPVFKITYNTSRKWLKLVSKKALGKIVYYHLFRHTAATRLSSKMNRQQLCIYFGWKFSSDMPDRYIKRAGVQMEDVEKHFSNTRIEELEEKLKKHEEFFEKILTEDMVNLTDEINKLK